MDKQPQDLNAERAIIACMLVNPDIIGEICSVLGENDFYIVTGVGFVALVIGSVAYIKSRKYDI